MPHPDTIPPKILRRIVPHVSEQHLDFGCGPGYWTYYIGHSRAESRIIGYDISEEKLCFARRRHGKDNILFTQSLEAIAHSGGFDSATLMFVLHEAGLSVMPCLRGLLSEGGRLFVIDYHLKGCGRRRFAEMFSTDPEMRELDAIGFEQAYAIHTSISLDDCIEAGEAAGFMTLERDILWNKYFMWVGEKKG